MGSINMDTLIKNLSSDETSVIYDALVNVRLHFANRTAELKTLERKEFANKLISFLNNSKLCSISLSILATCCLQSTFRREIIEQEGVKQLVNILTTVKNTEILNRVCRALGNIGMTTQGANEVCKSNVIELMVNTLSATEDSNLQHTLVRSLRILGGDSTRLKAILKSNGVFCIAKLLSHNEDVARVCVKALSLLTRNCSIICAMQLHQANVLPKLVDIYYNTSEDSNIQSFILTIFENLTHLPPMAEAFLEHKIIKIFIDEASSDTNSATKVQKAVLLLCLCCKHFRNRQEVRNMGGLPILIKVLKKDIFSNIQTEVLSCLVSLCCEINDLSKLREIELLSVCIQQLEVFIKKHRKDHTVINKGVSDETYSPDAKVRRRSNDAVFSIHSPTYQELQLSDSSSTKVYQSFISPVGVVPSTSPDFLGDWNLSSPKSCSSPLGPWSPGSSSNDPSMCWSPVMSSNSDSLSSSPRSPGPIHPMKPFDDLSDVDEKNSECDSNTVCEVAEISTNILQNKDANEKLVDSSCSRTSKRSHDEISDIILKMQETHKKLMITKCGGKSQTIPVSSPSKNTSNESLSNKKPINYSEMKCKQADSTNYLNLSDISSILPKPCDLSQFREDANIKKTESPNLTKNVDYCILTLLTHLANNLERTSNSEIVEETNIGVIMDYVAQLASPNQKATKILCNLISNRYSFEKLVMCNFIGLMESHMATPHEEDNCRRCSRLKHLKRRLMFSGRLIAESDFGVETLIHLLISSNGIPQLNCLYAIGKLIENRKLLYKIFYVNNGFKFLLNYFITDKETEFREAVQCLLILSYSIAGKYENIKPKKRATSNQIKNCQFEAGEFDVQFSLDDGTSVSASREVLCRSSDYFEGMLNGYFIEATQHVISLPFTSADSLLLIFHLLHGCTENSCIYWDDVNIDTLLKLLELTELFLLFHIKDIVVDKVIATLSESCIFRAYKAAKIYSSTLMSDVIHFLLCSSIINDESYFKILRNIAILDHRDFSNIIRKFLEVQLLKS